MTELLGKENVSGINAIVSGRCFAVRIEYPEQIGTCNMYLYIPFHGMVFLTLIAIWLDVVDASSRNSIAQMQMQ